LAVPGRWRVITMPATRTRRPLGARGRSIARSTPRQLVAPERHRMRPDRQPHPRIVGLNTLTRIHGSERGSFGPFGPFGSFSFVWDLGFGVWVLGFVVLSFKELPRRPDRALHLPERAPPLVGERVERADVGERRQLVAAEARPPHEVLD
jgi:hypothetical protein